MMPGMKPRGGAPPMPGGAPAGPGGPPGAAPGMNPQATMSAMKESRSLFNPQDVSMMIQDGTITMETPVAEVLRLMGIDVNGPFSQLAQKGGGVSQKLRSADPVSKMRGLARKQRPPAPPQEGPGNFSQMFPTGGGR